MKQFEAKVIAAAIGGGGLSGAVSPFFLWLLGVLVWHVSDTTDKAGAAIAAVPEPVSALLVGVMAAIGAGLAGYWAPHTSTSAPVVADPTSSGVSSQVSSTPKVVVDMQTPVATSGSELSPAAPGT
jgi:hypothetical protein